MSQTTITNLPGVTANLETAINLSTALTKAISPFHTFGFMTNRNVIDTAYKSADTKGSVAQVSITPVVGEEMEETTYDGTTELELSDFEIASYGKIDVPLDYAIGKKFGLRSPSADFAPREFQQMETDLMVSSFRHSILPRMFKRINERLRTSSFATTIGTTGTAVNIALFQALRDAVDSQGFENFRIEVRIHPDFYNAITNIAEFQSIRGTVPVVGNNMVENTTITNTKFSVFGKFNMDFIKDQYYLRPTPVSDPIFTATIDTSAVVPFRGLTITDPNTQVRVLEPNTGLMFRYDKGMYRTNVGETLGGRISAYYGFAELSGDINNAGVLQTAPIFNGMGGVA